MAGGDKAPVKRLAPVFDALAPESGWAHVDTSGAATSRRWCTTGSSTA